MAGSDERRAHPSIDLETVRETLAYMHADMAGVPALARVCSALGTAINEIRVLEGAQRAAPLARLRVVTSETPRFVPWSAQD